MADINLTMKALRYRLDLTGMDPNNLVDGEMHLLQNAQKRAIVLEYGAFYTESIVIVDVATGQPITKGEQFLAVQLNEQATTRSGKEVCSAIVITDPSVSSEVLVTYQVVGGPYILSVTAIEEMLNALSLDDRPVRWGEILGRLILFPPGHHLHDAGDVYGFEYLVLILDELRKAILMGDVASHDEIMAYIHHVEDSLGDLLDIVRGELKFHTENVRNPHQTTKAQVGLGNVENYRPATTEEGIDGTRQDLYVTPKVLKTAISSLAGTLLQNHIDDHNNPHQVTKGQIGLGNVGNYAMATDAEAVAATVTDKLINPKQQMDFRNSMQTISLGAPTETVGYREGHVWYQIDA